MERIVITPTAQVCLVTYGVCLASFAHEALVQGQNYSVEVIGKEMIVEVIAVQEGEPGDRYDAYHNILSRIDRR